MSIGDLAIQPGTNVLFGVRSNGGGTGRRQAVHDQQDDRRGDPRRQHRAWAGGGLAFAPDGSLYQTAFNGGLDFPSLNRIDPATAARLSTVQWPTTSTGWRSAPPTGPCSRPPAGPTPSLHDQPDHGGGHPCRDHRAGSTSDLAFRPAGLTPTVQLRGPVRGTLGGPPRPGPGDGRAPGRPGDHRRHLPPCGQRGGRHHRHLHRPVTLNAALEAEGPRRADQRHPAAAQDLAPSFLTLQTPQARPSAVPSSAATPRPLRPSPRSTSRAGPPGSWQTTPRRPGPPPGCGTCRPAAVRRRATRRPTASITGRGKGRPGAATTRPGPCATPARSPPPPSPSPPGRTSPSTTSSRPSLDSVDTASVQVSTNGFTTFTTVASRSPNLPNTTVWRAVAPIGLAAFAGQAVQIRWVFDTVDGT